MFDSDGKSGKGSSSMFFYPMGDDKSTRDKRPRRKKHIISKNNREALKSRVDSFGLDAVAGDMHTMNPYKSRYNHREILRHLLRKSSHSFSSTNHNLLSRLGKHYRNGTVPHSGPKKTTTDVVSSQNVDIVKPKTSDVDIATIISQAVTQGISQAMGGVLQTIQQHPVQYQQQRLLQQPAESQRQRSLSEMLSPREHARILHEKWAATLVSRDGFEKSKSYPTAWRLSYGSYDRETGLDVQRVAAEESRATGRDVKALDVIDRNGDLPRFIDIAKKFWEAQ